MKIIIEYLLIAIFITFLVLYVTSPKPRIILKYPNLKNEISDIYMDDNNICYRYHRNQVTCPNQETNFSKISIN